jgi:MFS family permease
MSFTSGPLRRNADLWITVVARAVSLLGDVAAVVALTLRLHDSGSGAWSIAALFIADLVPVVVLAPLVGALVDRYDSRVLLVWSGLAQAALCFALAQAHQTALVLGLVAALGAGEALNGTTWQALLPGIVGVERLPAAMGLSQAGSTAALIVAPALGGLLTGAYGARVPLLVDAATFLVIAAAGLLVRTRREVGRPAGHERRRAGYRLVRDDPMLVALLTMISLFAVLAGTVNVIEVYLVRDTLHSTATWYGIVGGAVAVGVLLGSMLGGRWSSELALVRIVLGTSAVLSLSTLGFAAAPEVGWLLPVAVVGGAANGLLNVGAGALVMMRAPEHARGRVSAAAGGVTSAAMIGAFVLGGVLAAFAGPRQIFLIAGLLGMLAPLTLGRWLLGACRSAGASADRVLTST